MPEGVPPANREATEREATVRAPIQDRARATRERLVRAAIEAAGAAGSADISLETMRGLARTSTATTYRYFRSVEAIQRVVFDEYVAVVHLAIGGSAPGLGIATPTPREQLERLGVGLASSRVSTLGGRLIIRALLARSASARAAFRTCANNIAVQLARTCSGRNPPTDSFIRAMEVAVDLYLLWHLHEGREGNFVASDVRRSRPAEELFAVMDPVILRGL